MYIKTVGYRFLAFMTDVLIGAFIGVILNLLFGFGTLDTSANNLSFSMSIYESTAMYTVYFAITEYLMFGQTPGKKLFEIHVRTVDMKEFEHRFKYMIRGFFKGLLVLASFFSFIVVVINKNNQSFHDLMVHTIVLRKVKPREMIES